MVILRQFLDEDTLEILEKILENVLAKSKNSIRIKHFKKHNNELFPKMNFVSASSFKNMGST